MTGSDAGNSEAGLSSQEIISLNSYVLIPELNTAAHCDSLLDSDMIQALALTSAVSFVLLPSGSTVSEKKVKKFWSVLNLTNRRHDLPFSNSRMFEIIPAGIMITSSFLFKGCWLSCDSHVIG